MERIRKYTPLWGTWNVKKQIGEGSFGAVYEVEKTVAGNTSFSAVKLISIKNSEMLQGLKMDETMSAEELAALKLENAKKSVREAALMDKLQGRDNIVTIYDYDIYPNEKTTDVLIRMELLRNLKDYLTEVRADENLVINLGIDLCKALEICEEEKIVHRDIKPENIFVNKDRHFKLGDFGLSRQMTKSASLSLRKSKGTPLYMPPEALRWGDDDYVDHTSDIYSLALVMYQLLNRGKIPFCSDMSDYDEQYMAIGKRVNGKEQIPAPENCREELWHVIKKACSYEKKDRYQNAVEMRKALEAIKNKLAAVAAEKDDENRQKKMEDDSISQTVASEEGYLKKAQEAWKLNQFEKAFQLYEKSASLGNAEGQYALGYCYDKGYGIDKDKEKALYWFEKAAAQGQIGAINTTKMLREQLKVEQPIKPKETKTPVTVPQTRPETSTKPVRTYNVGDTITFGSYPQDKGLLLWKKQPIEWVILKKEEEKILVISKKALDCKAYHKKWENVTWEVSDIRHWLNDSFYNIAFNSTEQEKIQRTFVKAEKNTKYDIEAGKDTEDKVFLLSINEAKSLFISDEARKCKPTGYAADKGRFIFEDIGNCKWWLRSLGSYTKYAVCVDEKGHENVSGFSISNADVGIRPAMWISFEA